MARFSAASPSRRTTRTSQERSPSRDASIALESHDPTDPIPRFDEVSTDASEPASAHNGATSAASPRTTRAKSVTKKPKAGLSSTATKRTSRKATSAKRSTDNGEPVEGTAGVGSRSGKRQALVIVESPKKAIAIGKFLGSGYVVKASKGHVRDLPKNVLGIDVDHEYRPTYEIIPKKEDTISELKRDANRADVVYLATDPDREGEAIAWHLKEALELPDEKVRRVRFHEITEKAVREAFQHAGPIDHHKVDAQQARRLMDRLMGYPLSQLLWKKVARHLNLSAGRVQSVAVRLIVEREKEIRAFVPEEYWEITATLSAQGKTDELDRFTAKLAEWKGSKFKVDQETQARAIRDALTAAEFVVRSVEDVEKKDPPAPPFKTSTLQQQASIRFRFSSDRTMSIAQQLYQGIDLGDGNTVGLITYMRTDSLRVSDEAIKGVREVIASRYGDAYLPAKPNQYEAGKLAQEAHEAIRPTDLSLTPESIQNRLTHDQFKLYQLIYRRFVASQMTPAIFAVTNVTIEAGEGVFKTQGKMLKFDGYRKVLPPAGKQEDALLPPLVPRQILDLHALEPSQHFTQPPPRYNEASLIKALEKENIGRPSTYATIIQKIQERNYVEQKDRRFYATNLGMVVTDLLVEHFPKMLDLKYTSHIEDELDRIMSAEARMVQVLDEFYHPFQDALKVAETRMPKVQIPSDKVCPTCGAPMVEKYNKAGKFLGCSRYPDCTTTMSADGTLKKAAVETEYECLKCGKPLVMREGKRGEFLSCSGYPECKETYQLDEDGRLIPTRQETDYTCSKCGKPMLKRQGPRGPFLGCSGYPKCKNTIQLDDQGQPVKTVEIDVKCPKCGGPMAIKQSWRGPFLGCLNYPKCRGTAPIPPELKESHPELFVNTRAEDPIKAALKSLTIDEPCGKCGKPMVVRQGKKGFFLGCTGYPKCREVREPDEATLERIQQAVAAAEGLTAGSPAAT